MAVRVGLMVAAPNDGEPGSTRRWIQAAEDAGLDHVSVGDHVSFYVGFGMDGLLRSAHYLGASDRISVNTGVYLLPLRHPVLVARQLSDIAAMGPGRFTFGIGVGGEDPHEVEICGVDPSTRGRRMDECIAIVRALLTGEPVDFDGEFFQLDRAQIVPAPSDPIPIVVGGRSDAAIRRAGRLGDGWFGIWVSPRRYAEVIGQMEEHASDAGRGEVRWTNALNVWCGVGDDAASARESVARAMQAFYQLPFERFERWSPHGSTEAVAEFLAPYVAAGCDVINLILQSPDRARVIDAAAEIRRHLHAHTTSTR